MGGYIAQEFALAYPDMIDGMMIVGATPVFMKYPIWETVLLKYSGPLLKLYPWKYLKTVMAKQSSVNESVQEKLFDMFSTFTKKEFIASWQGIATCLHEADVDFNFPLYAMCGDLDKTGR